MSKIKKDNPASVNSTEASPSPTISAVSSFPATTESLNFLAIANAKGPNDIATSGFMTHTQNADMSSMPGGPKSCYVPSTSIPEIPLNVSGDWNRGLIGPNPGDNVWNRDGLNPFTTHWPSQPTIPVPVTTGCITWTLPKSWGVMHKSVAERGGPDYWVVNPATLDAMGNGVNVVARCEDADHASLICDLLNSHTDSKQPTKTSDLKRSAQMITYEFFQRIIKDTAGRTLTVLDATFVNEQQNKAVKQLVKREFRETLTKIFTYCHRHDGSDEAEESPTFEDVLD
jgi:hypothetical protein